MTDQSETIIAPTPRDGRYYFSDGNIVLLVGGVLFKIHSSLLTEESEIFRDMFTLPAAKSPSGEPPAEETVKEGSCDEHPITIPEVTCLSFQNFLFMIYGRASDSEFVLTMADTTKTAENHSLPRFYHYLDVADLSHRFAAIKLGAWALGQLKGISRSFLSLAWEDTPNIDYQLRALRYARIINNKKLERQVQTFIEQSYRALLRAVIQSPVSAESARQQRLIMMFKYPGLQTDCPSLFGFILCVILGQGSQFWLNQSLLSREDRVGLLSAFVHLTPFPYSMLELDWVEGTLTEAHPRGNTPELQVCTQCDFWPSWKVHILPCVKQQKGQQLPEGGAIVVAV
ncbi:hypothetical protein BDV93DRAFT_608046 [Ceratobasidium sp. AG-I]|nr:hypothetical protein BDV93DRAFT_608046 [Ceratobasidium sp. AG-I]